MKRWLLAGAFLALTLPTAGAQAVLPSGFDVFMLGQTLEELKAALKNNSYFIYSGEPDVTLLTRPNTNLIDVPGVDSFARGVFQVVDGRLYSITLELNREQLDYFTMYTALTKKYGNPTALDPSSARWENTSIRLSLEKPLTVKYIDMVVFQKLQQGSRTDQALQALVRERFLEEF